MNKVQELNCLELEVLSAGGDKGGPAPTGPNGQPQSARDRVIEWKKAMGLPEFMWTWGVPWFLPR